MERKEKLEQMVWVKSFLWENEGKQGNTNQQRHELYTRWTVIFFFTTDRFKGWIPTYNNFIKESSQKKKKSQLFCRIAYDLWKRSINIIFGYQTK